MIRVKKEICKTKKFPFPLMSQVTMYFLQNMGRCGWLFYKEIWEDWGFCLLPKILTPAKENSRAWTWALQQNIMGLNFKTYPIEEPVNDTLSAKDDDDEKQVPRRHQS